MESANLKVSELRKELKARGLSIAGTKQELIVRLEEVKNEKTPEELSTLDDSLLDDDEILDEEEENSNEPIITSPITLPVASTKEGGEDKLNLEEVVSEVKVTEASISLSGIEVAKTEIAAVETAVTGTVRLIKTDSKLGEDEKIKLRLDKFGVVGGATSGKTTKSDDADILKKRNERFGVTSVGGKITLKTADDLKLSKRKERFGENTKATDEKKLKRAERFKTK